MPGNNPYTEMQKTNPALLEVMRKDAENLLLMYSQEIEALKVRTEFVISSVQGWVRLKMVRLWKK